MGRRTTTTTYHAADELCANEPHADARPPPAATAAIRARDLFLSDLVHGFYCKANTGNRSKKVARREKPQIATIKMYCTFPQHLSDLFVWLGAIWFVSHCESSHGGTQCIPSLTGTLFPRHQLWENVLLLKVLCFSYTIPPPSPLFPFLQSPDRSNMSSTFIDTTCAKLWMQEIR